MEKYSKKTKQNGDDVLKLFSKQSKVVREYVRNIIDAHDTLLDLNAFTFEDIALIPFAVKAGYNAKDPLLDFRKIIRPCVHCGEKEHVKRIGNNLYKCLKCGEKYSANYKSISSGSKVDAVVWMKVFLCMLEYRTVEYTCDVCDISKKTYYNIRNKLYYGLILFMREVKLYGRIMVDNTELKLSYKGMNLGYIDYPDDSPMFRPQYSPRNARRHGGPNKKKFQNENSIRVFCAVDEFGHTITAYAGIGAVTNTRLAKCVPEEKILLHVPDNDPFPFMKEQKSEALSKSGDESIMFADKESAIKKFATKRGYSFESHVYRKKNVQLNLGKNVQTIQKVNSLHSRLDLHLARSGSGSSRFLPGELALFEFRENTGCSQEAIDHLFQILTEPFLGLDSYDELFTIPKPLIEALEDGSFERKISFQEAYADFLYHNYKLKKKVYGKFWTVKEICEETGYRSDKTVRKNYAKALSQKGAIEKIVEIFSREESILTKQLKKAQKSSVAFTPEDLSAYKDHQEFLLKRHNPGYITAKEHFKKLNSRYKRDFSKDKWKYLFRKIEASKVLPPLRKPQLFETQFALDAFDYMNELRANYNFNKLGKYERVDALNERFGVSYSHEYWRIIFNKIVEAGLRDSLVPIGSAGKRYPYLPNEDNAIKKALEILDAFNKCTAEITRETGMPATTMSALPKLAEMFNLTEYTINLSLALARKYRKLEYKAKQEKL